jgi:hypothetical protein
VQLLEAEDLAGLSRRQRALFHDAVDLQRQVGLQQFLLRMRQSKIGEDIAAAVLYTHARLVHVSSDFPEVIVLRKALAHHFESVPRRPGFDVFFRSRYTRDTCTASAKDLYIARYFSEWYRSTISMDCALP